MSKNTAKITDPIWDSRNSSEPALTEVKCPHCQVIFNVPNEPAVSKGKSTRELISEYCQPNAAGTACICHEAQHEARADKERLNFLDDLLFKLSHSFRSQFPARGLLDSLRKKP